MALVEVNYITNLINPSLVKDMDDPDTVIADRIDMAESITKTDLSGITKRPDIIYSWTIITDVPEYSRGIVKNLIAFKTMELFQRWKIETKKDDADKIETYEPWKQDYEELLGKIASGQVNLFDDSTSISSSISPASTKADNEYFGQRDFGLPCEDSICS